MFRNNSYVVTCRDLKEQYDTILDITENGFVTGYQCADGLSGRWYSWNSIESIYAPVSPSAPNKHPRINYNIDNWLSTLSEIDFIASVKSMIRDMARGEYFLANLTRQLHTDVPGELTTTALWSCLLHDTRFRFILTSPFEIVLGLSPERFMKIQNREVTCEPIKGTASTRDGLIDNEKEHTENTMMIDLVRSDLSKIAKPETITVVDRNRITTHPGLIHMSSTIKAILKDDLSIPQAVQRMMPIASVTGTPKPFVVRKIPTYEKYNRKIYCGTYGWIDTENDLCDLAVGIRTIHANRTTSIGTGSGITIDSSPPLEYKETQLKASRLIELVELGQINFDDSDVFTSFSIDKNGEAVRLDEHCARLYAHALRQGFKIERVQLLQEVNSFLSSKAQPLMKVKVTVDKLGKITCEITELPKTNSKGIALGIVPFPRLAKDDVVKFTNREIYENTLNAAKSICGKIDDTLLYVRGNCTETTRSNVFIRHGSVVATPPLKNGILDGISRARLIRELENGIFKLRITQISLDDIVTADEIVTCNSLRGAQHVCKLSSPLIETSIDFERTNTKLFDIASSII